MLVFRLRDDELVVLNSTHFFSLPVLFAFCLLSSVGRARVKWCSLCLISVLIVSCALGSIYWIVN